MQDSAKSAPMQDSPKVPCYSHGPTGDIEKSDDDCKGHAPHRGSSAFVAMLHIICITAGVGVLNLPKVVADGGWLTIMFFPIMSSITDYTSRLIVKCLYLAPPAPDANLDDVKAGRPVRMRGFADVGRAAYGKVGLYTVQIFHKIVLFGICVVFLILAGSCAKQLFDPIFSIVEWQWILIITAALTIPVLFLKSMKEVIWTSAVGFSSTVFLVIVTVILCIVELQSASSAQIGSVRHDVLVWSHLPLSMAGICFAYCGNYVYPNIEETMAQPQQFGRTVSLSMLFITAMYVPVAALAYLVYGSGVQSPVLLSFPFNGWVIALLIFIGAHVLATLPLPLVSLIIEAEAKIGLGPGGIDGTQSVPSAEVAKSQSWQMRFARGNASALLRLAFLGSISLIACVFYNSFTDIMDFFGAIANSSFLFFFPVIFYIKLKGWRNISAWELSLDAFILVIGTITTFFGGYQAGMNLLSSFRAPFS